MSSFLETQHDKLLSIKKCKFQTLSLECKSCVGYLRHPDPVDYKNDDFNPPVPFLPENSEVDMVCDYLYKHLVATRAF